jgi:hypothetical protein
VPYRLPNFNLVCEIGPAQGWVGTWPPPLPFAVARLSNQPCALVFGRRVGLATSGGTADPGYPTLTMNLLLPARVDIRSNQGVNITPDAVEVPSGSQRWYAVASVDDIGRGYANEHRVAILQPIAETWAVPYG